MNGKLSTFRWTDKSERSKDLIFIAIILAFGVLLVAKLAPYYQEKSRTVVYNSIQTVPNTPKDLVEKTEARTNFIDKTRPGVSGGAWASRKNDRKNPSVAERPLFDGQSVILKVRSLNPFSSKEANQILEATVVSPFLRDTDGSIDFSITDGAKLVGTGSANFSTKRLFLTFTEMVSKEGRGYPIQAQAIDRESLASGISGDYSSGLPTRLLGIALDRAIMAADQVGTAYLFSSIGPQGPANQEFKKAAMETNNQASQNLAAEATKDLRETSQEIALPSGSEFYVRVRTEAKGVVR